MLNDHLPDYDKYMAYECNDNPARKAKEKLGTTFYVFGMGKRELHKPHPLFQHQLVKVSNTEL